MIKRIRKFEKYKLNLDFFLNIIKTVKVGIMPLHCSVVNREVKLTQPWRTTFAGMNQEMLICSLLSKHCIKTLDYHRNEEREKERHVQLIEN